MLKTSLAVIVALCAVFVGAIWYNAYLPISDELKGDQKAIPFLFHFNEFLARIVSDRLGLLPKYKFFRWYFTSISTSTFLAKPNTEGISIEESIISGVPVKIFRPKETQSDNQHNWLPGVIYVHGGGLILGSVNFTCYIEQCAMIARDTKSVVISVEYRLSPEHSYLTQFNDCYSVVNTVVEKSEKLGILQNKIAIAGDSAGGLLAAAVSLEFVRQDRSSELVAQVLIYPWLQFIDTICLPSFQKYKQGFQMDEKMVSYTMSAITVGDGHMAQEYLNGNVARYFMKTPYWQYLEIPDDSNCESYKDSTDVTLPSEFVNTVTDPRLSPLLAENLEGSPMTLLLIAGYDILGSEAFAYGKRLAASGVPTAMKTYQSCHGFLYRLTLPLVNKTIAKQAMKDIADFLNSAFYK